MKKFDYNSTNNPLIDICKRYLAACNAIELSDEVKTLSLDPILETVPLVLKKPGLVYEIMTPSTLIGMGGECTDYARPEDAPPFAEIADKLDPFRHPYLPEPYIPLWQSLDWTFTPEGMWEWILVHDLWHNLPLFWHANYSQVDYVLNKEDYIEILPNIAFYLTPTGRPKKWYKEDIERWAKHERKAGYNPFGRTGYKTKQDMFTAIEMARTFDKDFAPKAVQIDEKTIDVTFCVWNAWAGLKQICYRMERSKRLGIKMTRTVDNLLIKYTCGICF